MSSNYNLDEKSKEMLQVIYDRGGESNTSEIKRETGMQNQSIHHRYDKLEDRGLITTRQGTSDTGRLPPKVAELTEEGEEAIRKGLIGDVFESSVPDSVEVSKSDFDDLRDSMERLETRLNSVNDAVSSLEKEVDEGVGGEIEGDVSKKDVAELKQRIRLKVKQIEGEMDELQEDIDEVRDRTDTAVESIEDIRHRFNKSLLPFLRAFDSAFKEEFGIDIQDEYMNVGDK